MPEKKTKHISETVANHKAGRYFEAVGRRKTATARVRVTYHKGAVKSEAENFSVNGKEAKEYFPSEVLRQKIYSPLGAIDYKESFSVSAKVSGSGLNAQAEAVRHGLARALVVFKEEFKTGLSRAGFLKRDPRMVERKKYGLKKARRAPQWAKR